MPLSGYNRIFRPIEAGISKILYRPAGAEKIAAVLGHLLARKKRRTAAALLCLLDPSRSVPALDLLRSEWVFHGIFRTACAGRIDTLDSERFADSRDE